MRVIMINNNSNNSNNNSNKFASILTENVITITFEIALSFHV